MNSKATRGKKRERERDEEDKFAIFFAKSSKREIFLKKRKEKRWREKKAEDVKGGRGGEGEGEQKVLKRNIYRKELKQVQDYMIFMLLLLPTCLLACLPACLLAWQIPILYNLFLSLFSLSREKINVLYELSWIYVQLIFF